MLVNVGGRDLVVIGQKSGVGWALDPDKQGAVVWQYRAGRGSALGGMEWGSAADAERAYFLRRRHERSAGRPGCMPSASTTASASGWPPPPPTMCGEPARGCSPAILAAISVILAWCSWDRTTAACAATSTKDGSILWQFDTNKEFETVNGVQAKGATINGPRSHDRQWDGLHQLRLRLARQAARATCYWRSASTNQQATAARKLLTKVHSEFSFRVSALGLSVLVL